MSDGDLLHELMETYGLNATDEAIAAYMLAHLEEMPSLGVRDLAKKSYVSASAVMRFVKKIGYDSFPAFKYQIHQKMKTLQMKHGDLEDDVCKTTLLEQVEERQTNVTKQTMASIPRERWAQIVEALRKAEVIDWIADDTNATLANYGMHILWGLGKRGQVFSSLDLQMNASLLIPDTHFVIALSKYGLKSRWADLLARFHENGVKVMLVTGKKPPAWSVDFVVETCFSVQQDLAAEMDYYIGAKYVIDTMFWVLFQEKKDQARRKQALRNAIFFQKK
ncbi:MurR/RpiR family transcriptional regulator [uncultured Dubosiella sp.]|uniref:MurR/RpiR family transcriptional regulator n=1 Tax=uncultured Dubosiella sp. TaxID=1937011 RepID=UPI0027302739|nr:MurR/RpiR family transcriptional regulator [uncultured Dubosiella sp.]